LALGRGDGVSELVINIEKIPNLDKAALVIVKGSIDAKTVIQFQRKLNSVIEDGTNRIIIDMEQVKYVNSTGLGYLINLADTVGGDSGSVVFANVQPKVKVVFDMLGLNAFFRMFNSRDQALKAVAGPAGAAAQPAVQQPPAPQPQPKPPAPVEPPAEQTQVVTQQRQPAPATPRPAATPTPAPAAAGAEKVQIDCKLCKAVLIIEGVGTYKCPRCFAMFNFSGGDKLIFLPKRPIYPVQMTLNFTNECTEGLLSFVGLLGKKAASVNGLQAELRGLVESIRKHAYQGNENNIYHVQVITKESELEMRFVDYGKPMGDQVFTKIKAAVDRFEVKPHPRGGNIISLTKKLG
jgi:anti-sigma B factor antagonist